MIAAAAAVVVVATVAVVLAVAPAREAVGRWFGIGSTRIERSETTLSAAELPRLAEGLVAALPADAERALGRPLPDLSGGPLGEPAFAAVAPEGGVIVAWADGTTTLWIRQVGNDEQIFRKLVGIGTGVEEIDGLGDRALLISGHHFLSTPSRVVAAGSVLLWLDDGLELRLESDADRDVMIAIASAIGT